MANNTARLRRGSYRGGQPSFVTSLNTFRRPRRFLKQSTDRRTGPSLSNELCIRGGRKASIVVSTIFRLCTVRRLSDRVRVGDGIMIAAFLLTL